MHALVHALGLTASSEQRPHLFQGRVGPPTEKQQEVLIDVCAHPLDCRLPRCGPSLVRTETLREAIVAASRCTLQKGRGAVTRRSENLREGHGFVREIVTGFSQRIGGRVHSAEHGRERRQRLRRLSERPLEAHRLGGEGVECGSPGQGAVTPEGIRPQSIHRENDYRMRARGDDAFLGLLAATGHQDNQPEKTGQRRDHHASENTRLFHFCNTLLERRKSTTRQRGRMNHEDTKTTRRHEKAHRSHR